MKAKIVSRRGDEVQIRPTYATAAKMSLAKGNYKWFIIVGVLLIVAAFVILWLASTDRVDLEKPNGLLFVLIGAGLGCILGKPSQVMVDNYEWVKESVWIKAIGDGTEDKLFKRYW